MLEKRRTKGLRSDVDTAQNPSSTSFTVLLPFQTSPSAPVICVLRLINFEQTGTTQLLTHGNNQAQQCVAGTLYRSDRTRPRTNLLQIVCFQPQNAANADRNRIPKIWACSKADASMVHHLQVQVQVYVSVMSASNAERHQRSCSGVSALCIPVYPLRLKVK